MKRIFLLVMAGLMAFSCAKDPVNDINGTTGSGMKARLTTPGFSEVSTRSTDEYAISNVWALQYVNNILVKKTDLTSTPGLFSGFDLPAEPMDASTAGNVIYFFANTAVNGSDPIGTDPAFALGKTLTDLNSYQFTIDENTFESNLPMRGEYRGAVVAGKATEATINMTRMAVKINFSFDATALTQFVAKSIQLCNVPTMTALPANAYQPALPISGATAANPTGFAAYPTGTFGNYDEQTIDWSLAAKGDYTWYMPENVRGSFMGVASNRDKNPLLSTNGFNGNDAGYTYILLKGTCIAGGELKEVEYKIYLGGNEMGDMNLIANTIYNVTTTIVGVNSADTRITVTTPDITTLLPLPKANSYILNAKTEGQIFYIPVSQAVDGIDKVNEYYGSTALTFASTSNWTADVLWQTWQATSIDNQLAISRATGSGTEKDFIRVVLPKGVSNGNNAVIALKAANGDILWSWHLWITDYNPDTETNGALHAYSSDAFGATGIYNGKKIMDRNLGATWTGGTPDVATITDAATAAKAYGLLYQWGRKDAFTPASGTSTTAAAAIYGGAIGSAALTEGTGTTFTGINRVSLASAADVPNNLANAVQHPTFFYFSGQSNDWYVGAGSGGSQNNALWSGTAGTPKSVFDPCPAGYRVPVGGATAANNPWAGFNGFGSANVTNYTYNANGTTTATGNPSPTEKTIFQWYLNGGKSVDVSESIDGMRGTGSGATAGRLYTSNGVNAWYPASGNRSSTSGAFGTVGSNGYSWSGSVTGTNGYSLSFYSTSVSPASGNGRANGFPVRCLQE